MYDKGEMVPESLIELIIDKELILKIEEHHRFMTNSFFSYTSDSGSFDFMINKILSRDMNEDERILLIYSLLPLMTALQKQQTVDIIMNSIEYLNQDMIMRLVEDRHIKMTEKIEERLFDLLKQAKDRRIAKPGVVSYPDQVEETINRIIILYLLGYLENIDKLNEYTYDSEYALFILKPSEAKNIDIKSSDYMWMNILKEATYRDRLTCSQKDNIINEIEYMMENGTANRQQMILYYRHLANKKVTW